MNNEQVDRTAEIIERRVAAAALQIQAQFAGVTKMIDMRVDGNKEQSEARLNAMDELCITRVQALRDYIDAHYASARERSEERWRAWREATTERAKGLADKAATDVINAQTLIETRLDGLDKARALQAIEYERRLADLNHEHKRADSVQAAYVRADIYNKDMERIYNERREAMAAAETARNTQDVAAATNRRNTMLTMMTAAISLIAVIISVLMHFSGAPIGSGP